MKLCAKCDAKKPTTEFNVDRQKRDGLRSRCRPCDQGQARRHPVSVPGKLCRSCKQTLPASAFSLRSRSADGLAARCKPCHREYALRWWATNGSDQCASRRTYHRTYYSENRLRWRVYKLRRRAAGGREISTATIAEIVSSQNGLCGGCRLPLGGSFHIDHRVPLSRGGTGDRSNLQAMHPRCNLSKGVSLPGERRAAGPHAQGDGA